MDDDDVRTQTSFPPVVARFRGCRFSDNSDVHVTLYVEEIAGCKSVVGTSAECRASLVEMLDATMRAFLLQF